MRIGELAAAAGTTTKTLRFYEETGLLPPTARTATGYRDYSSGTLARLAFIRRGRAAGLTLAQIGEVLDLRDRGGVPCRHGEQMLCERLAALDAQIADLQLLRDTVTQLHHEVSAGDPNTCQPEEICRYL